MKKITLSFLFLVALTTATKSQSSTDCATYHSQTCQIQLLGDIDRAKTNLYNNDWDCLSNAVDFITDSWAGFFMNMLEQDIDGFFEDLQNQASVFEEIQQSNDCISDATDMYGTEMDDAGFWWDVCMDSMNCP